MQQNTPLRLAALLASGLLSTALVLNAADKPKHSIKDVMKAVHKGDDALCKKVVKGDGSKDDFKKLVECYSALPHNDAPKGDAKSWQEKTTALLDAAKALEAGKAGALDQYKAAVNCKACHSAHKPD